jgi:hypothetical protein
MNDDRKSSFITESADFIQSHAATSLASLGWHALAIALARVPQTVRSPPKLVNAQGEM